MSRTSLRIIFNAILITFIILVGVRHQAEIADLKQPILQRLQSFLPINISPQLSVENPLVIQTSPEGLTDAINAYRQKAGAPAYLQDDISCRLASELTDQSLAPSENFLDKCTECSRGAVVHISSQAPAVRLIAEIKNNQAESDLVSGSEHTNLCITEKDGTLTLFFASYHPNSIGNTSVKTSSQYQPQPTTPPKNFSENQLWQALVDYRHAHTRPDLERDENLCRYARKRVQEHIEKYATTPKSEYPNQDKYPLDAHAGFERDGNSGELFTITDRRVVAENLAYWPSAQFPHQVVEWGWDTSTEGHREAQLSTEYSHACLSGQDGFYVAIFGRS